MPLMKVPKAVAKKPKKVVKRIRHKKISADALSSVEVLNGAVPSTDVVELAYKIASLKNIKFTRYGVLKVAGQELKCLGSGITCTAYQASPNWVVKVHHRHETWEKSVEGIKVALTKIPKHVPSASLVKGPERTVMIQEFLIDSNDIGDVGALSRKCEKFKLYDVRGGNVGKDTVGIIKIMDFGNYRSR